MNTLSGLIRHIAVVPIRLYKYCISPLLPPACRFLPTCSEYATQAVLRHGIVKGGFLALARIVRCHPLAQGGYDPVPPIAGSSSYSDLGTAAGKPEPRPGTPPPAPDDGAYHHCCHVARNHRSH